jgi:HAD superfamily hydrolase (TIGR01509 family)
MSVRAGLKSALLRHLVYDIAVYHKLLQAMMNISPHEPILPTALLCDMDGLLLDTENLSFLTFNTVAGRHGFSDDGTIFNQLIGLSRKDHQRVFAENLPREIDPEDFDDQWKAEFLAMLEEDIPVKPGAGEMLSWLSKQAVPIALVTSTRTAKAEMLMQRAGFDVFLDALIGGDQVKQGKPAPDIYLKAADDLGHSPEDCLALEDSANGVRAAHASGARVIQVVDLVPPDSELLLLGHTVTSSLIEMAELLGWKGMLDHDV